jgi:hypothetical protein
MIAVELVVVTEAAVVDVELTFGEVWTVAALFCELTVAAPGGGMGATAIAGVPCLVDVIAILCYHLITILFVENGVPLVPSKNIGMILKATAPFVLLV